MIEASVTMTHLFQLLAAPLDTADSILNSSASSFQAAVFTTVILSVSLFSMMSACLPTSSTRRLFSDTEMLGARRPSAAIANHMRNTQIRMQTPSISVIRSIQQLTNFF